MGYLSGLQWAQVGCVSVRLVWFGGPPTPTQPKPHIIFFPFPQFTPRRSHPSRPIRRSARRRIRMGASSSRLRTSFSSAPPPPRAPAPHIMAADLRRTPYADVDCTLRALAGAAEGFGRHAIGGLHGPLRRVTSLEDDGPGTLREACRAQGPLWIVFEVSGTIHLHSYLRVSSHKTIDGRGQRVRLTGKGLQLKECHHVIVCNLELEGGRGHDVDGIQIKPASTHIWIDRCSLADYDDGLIDITRGSTDITVSRCRFSRHDKTMLVGADPSHVGDRCIRVTIHHCFFDGTRQRHPRLRFGKVHLYNNYTRGWGIYAACASVEAEIVSQSNIYEAGVGADGKRKTTVFRYMPEKAADRDDVVAGWIRSEGDAFLGGAQPCLVDGPGVQAVFRPEEYYGRWSMEAASPELKEMVQLCAGWQPVPRPPDYTSSPSPVGIVPCTVLDSL